MQKKKKTVTTVIVSILLLLILAGSCVYFYFFHGLTPGRILNNVTVSGIDVGGQTPEEAVSTLRSAAGEIYSQTMEVFVDPYTVTIEPEIANVSINVEAAAQAAFDLGRVGSYFERRNQKASAASGGYDIDIDPYLSLDEDAVREKLDTFLKLFESELTQTSYKVEGVRPDLMQPIEQIVPQTLVITKGTSLYELDMDALYELVLEGYHNKAFHVESACTVTDPDELDIQEIYDEYCAAPIDAVMDEKFQISRESNGYDFDLEAVQEQFDRLPSGKYMEVTFRLTAPEVTYDSLYATLYQDVLASYTASQASSSDRATNLRLACEAINGTILYPGETFSFNKVVGERTPEKGYRPAAAYVDGESVASYGGGVCQVASTIYYCCLYADFEIVERTWHMYPVSYVPFGMDATIYWGLLDYKFTNNFNYPVRIEAYADGGSVTVNLVGTDEKDYYVKMQYAVIEVLEPETVEVEMTADNPDGYKNGDEITSPHTGYHVRTYKYKYSKADDTLLESYTEADSHYRKRDREIAKIPEPPAPTEPVMTEPVPTEPAATEPAATEPAGVSGAVTPDG